MQICPVRDGKQGSPEVRGWERGAGVSHLKGSGLITRTSQRRKSTITSRITNPDSAGRKGQLL